MNGINVLCKPGEPFMRREAAGIHQRRRPSGFSIIELMISITIVAILLVIAAPSLRDALLSSKLSAQANNLVASATLARSEAIKRNASTTLCIPDSTFTSCAAAAVGGWEQGWIVLSGTTVIARQQGAPLGFSIVEASGVSTVNFMPDIIRAAPNSWKICRASPGAGTQERVVTVSITGRPTIAKTTDGVCP